MSPPRPTGRYAVFSQGMNFSKQIRSDYFPVKPPGHGCHAVPKCCADEADALDTALSPLLEHCPSPGGAELWWVPAQPRGAPGTAQAVTCGALCSLNVLLQSIFRDKGCRAWPHIWPGCSHVPLCSGNHRPASQRDANYKNTAWRA